MSYIMAISFNDFKQFNTPQQNNNGFRGRAPQGWFVYGKHDSRNGQASIFINAHEENGQNVDRQAIDVDSFEFVPLIAMQTVSGSAGNIENYSGTFSLNNIYNVVKTSRKQDDNSITDMGLYRGGNETRDLGVYSQYRLFGILRAVNGKAPNKLPQLNAIFGNTAIPVIVDLNWHKWTMLQDKANVTNRYDLTAVTAKDIVFEGGKDHGQYKTSIQDYYSPEFIVNPLDDEHQAKMSEYAQDRLKEVADFAKQVQERDQFYNDLYKIKHGQESAGLLNQVAQLGITDMQSLKAYQEANGGLNGLINVLNGATTSATTTPATPAQPSAPAPQPAQPTTPAPQPSPEPNFTDNTIDDDDDDLPF